MKYSSSLILAILSAFFAFTAPSNAQDAGPVAKLGNVPSGSCRPVYFQDTFRRVYRQNQMFLEGIADITGDGKPDAYGYEHLANGTFQNVVILPNDNAGGFGDPMIVTTTLPIDNAVAKYDNYGDHYYGALVVGDLNNDGRKDFVVKAESSPPALFSMQNNGDGSFTQSAPTLTGTYERVIDIADLNGDGRGDLLTTLMQYNQPQTLSYRLGNGDGTFGSAVQVLSLNYAWISAVVGNFAGDSNLDIASVYYNYDLQNLSLVVLTNLGGGLFSQSPPIVANMALAGVADLNGDGFLDIYGGAVLLGNASGSFTRMTLPQSPLPDFPTNFSYYWPHHYLADFDGDGHKDVVEALSGQVSLSSIRKSFINVFWNNGTAQFTKTIIKQPFLGIPADMNGDGTDEQVIFRNSTSGVPRPTLTSETVVIVRSGVCTLPASTPRTNIIDFGGDGISDIALFRGSSNGQWEFRSNLTENTFNWGANGDIPVTGDFDGDGKSDAGVFRPSTGTWYVFKSANGSVLAFNFGLSGDIPIPADYDGDGFSDIAVYRPSEGNWYFWFTGTQQFLGVHWGVNGDRPVPNDYDGDGKVDIAIFRPSEGNWFYLRSLDGDFRGIHWGLSSDIPVPADFDMDGKADLTVFRPSNGVWYTLRSYDGGVSICPFGQNLDVPMAVDSDGDGIMEPAVYRSGTGGGWYAGAQPIFTWGVYIGEKPVRLLLPN